jgi:hypothetical protein
MPVYIPPNKRKQVAAEPIKSLSPENFPAFGAERSPKPETSMNFKSVLQTKDTEEHTLKERVKMIAEGWQILSLNAIREPGAVQAWNERNAFKEQPDEFTIFTPVVKQPPAPASSPVEFSDDSDSEEEEEE